MPWRTAPERTEAPGPSTRRRRWASRTGTTAHGTRPVDAAFLSIRRRTAPGSRPIDGRFRPLRRRSRTTTQGRRVSRRPVLRVAWMDVVRVVGCRHTLLPRTDLGAPISTSKRRPVQRTHRFSCISWIVELGHAGRTSLFFSHVRVRDRSQRTQVILEVLPGRAWRQPVEEHAEPTSPTSMRRAVPSLHGSAARRTSFPRGRRPSRCATTRPAGMGRT
eukprot:scaffold324_cov326-Pavlova_lutheri.AAC.38